MAEEERSRIISVRFPPDIYRWAKAFAALSGQSFNSVVVTGLQAYLDQHANEDAITAMIERHRDTLRRRPSESPERANPDR